MIGERLVRIALLGQSDIDVCIATAPTLKAAAIEFGEAVFLSRFREKGVEIIHVEIPADPRRSFVHPGLGDRPMHACSCSKAIAAFAEESFRTEILSGSMRAYTEHTKTSKRSVEREFATIRRKGYSECVEELELGVSSVAVPIRVGNIGVTFSVGATGPIRRFNAAHRKKIGKRLIEISAKAAAAIRLYNNRQPE